MHSYKLVSVSVIFLGHYFLLTFEPGYQFRMRTKDWLFFVKYNDPGLWTFIKGRQIDAFEDIINYLMELDFPFLEKLQECFDAGEGRTQHPTIELPWA